MKTAKETRWPRTYLVRAADISIQWLVFSGCREFGCKLTWDQYETYLARETNLHQTVHGDPA